MTHTQEAAMRQALEALGLWATGRDMDAVALNDLIHCLEAALAEPQSTFAWWRDGLTATLMREGINKHRAREIADSIITALRAALAEPVQEPVAWQWLDTAHFRKKIPAHSAPSEWRPLYTAPPQRKPLTDAEIGT